MKILLSGAFGNIGTHTLEALRQRGHAVRCFDVPTRTNLKTAGRFGGQVDICWGDLRRLEDLSAAVQDQEAVVHLAFVIPHLSATGASSEARPDWARSVNVEGTRNLIQALQAQPRPARLVFASSLHVFGRTQDRPPPRRATDPVQPVEHYAHHKVECEALVRASGLEWAILRLPATLPVRPILDSGMFEVPLGNRIEFAHVQDVATAFANAVESDAIWGQLLLIGGGPRCQFYYGDLVRRVLKAVGVGMLPAEAFALTPYSTDWLETAESQRLLNYQRRTLDDYLRDLRAGLGRRRLLVQLFRPLIRRWLLAQSPYFTTL
jgi:nucleoside-diphosphate-sugar epimerase